MLDAYTVTLQMIRSLRTIVEEIKRHDSDLADQAVRAANSVLLNINEGRKRRGKDQARFFSYAGGSNSEVRACIDGAFAWGYLREGENVNNALAFLDRLGAMLWRLSHSR